MALTAPTPTGKFNRRTGAPETPRRLECPNVPRRFRVFLGDNGHDSWTWHDLEGESGYDWAPDYEILP